MTSWWPKVRGIGRVEDNEKAIILYFDRSLTDDEMREIHLQLNGKKPFIEPSQGDFQRHVSDMQPGLPLSDEPMS